MESSLWNRTVSHTIMATCDFFCNYNLASRKEDYVIDCRIKNNGNDGKAARAHAVAMFIQVYKPLPVVQWFDVDLDDKKYFNPDLEYKVKVKGKTTAYAITVNREHLWVFYGESNPGIKCVKYSEKRAFDNQYLITRMQCSVRKST
eukprot:577295_1